MAAFMKTMHIVLCNLLDQVPMWLKQSCFESAINLAKSNLSIRQSEQGEDILLHALKLLVLTALSIAPCGAWPQSFPIKPIRIVCGFPPGTAVDLV